LPFLEYFYKETNFVLELGWSVDPKKKKKKLTMEHTHAFGFKRIYFHINFKNNKGNTHSFRG